MSEENQVVEQNASKKIAKIFEKHGKAAASEALKEVLYPELQKAVLESKTKIDDMALEAMGEKLLAGLLARLA